MSTDDKERLNDVMKWILRGLTAMGAFFLLRVYFEVADTRRMLEDMRIERARIDTEIMWRLTDHERRIGKIENKREP
jgi:hypothetical protein